MKVDRDRVCVVDSVTEFVKWMAANIPVLFDVFNVVAECHI